MTEMGGLTDVDGVKSHLNGLAVRSHLNEVGVKSHLNEVGVKSLPNEAGVKSLPNEAGVKSHQSGVAVRNPLSGAAETENRSVGEETVIPIVVKAGKGEVENDRKSEIDGTAMGETESVDVGNVTEVKKNLIHLPLLLAPLLLT